MKSGWQTSEFWMTFFSIIGYNAAAFEKILEPKFALFATMLSTIAYALSRGLAKKGQKHEKPVL